MIRARRTRPAAAYRIVLLAGLLTTSLLGCQPAPPDAGIETISLDAFGTLVDVSLWPANDADVVRIDAEIRAAAEELHDAWHAWKPGPLQRINQGLRNGEKVAIPPDLASLIERSRTIETTTGGRFNAAIGELVAAWGFHQDEPGGPPPDVAWLENWMQSPPALQDLDFDGTHARSHNPRVQLDFGAIAKGAAARELLDRLASLGVEHAIINLGGDLIVTGQPGERPWNIGIRDPAGGVLGGLTLEARDADRAWALFTSGTYERGYEYRGERIHHILDPLTGQPARGLLSATVLHDDPMEADAWATALIIAGADVAPRLAAALGIRHWMLLGDDDVLQISPALEKRFTPSSTTEGRYRIRVIGDDASTADAR